MPLITDDSNNYLRSILNAFGDQIFVIDSHQIITDFLKESTLEWLSIPREQLIAKPYSEVLPPHISRKLDEAILGLQDGNETSSFEYDMLLRGRTIWLSVVVSLIPDSEGIAPKYLWVAREITARKTTEILLEGVLENAFSSFFVLRAIRNEDDQIVDFNFLMANNKAERLSGKTEAELLCTSLRQLDQPWSMFDKYVSVVETGEPLDQEYRFRWMESVMWVHTHVSKFEDGVVVTLKDISDKKNTEHHLETAIDQLKLTHTTMDMFFQQAVTGFFFATLDEPQAWHESTDKESALDYIFAHLHFTKVNDALLKQYDLSFEELVQYTPNQFFKYNLKEVRALFRELYDKGRLHINQIVKRPDGSEMWLEGEYVSMNDQHGRILGHYGTQLDVTEARKSEDLLRQSEKRYRLLANNMMDMVALHEADGTYVYVSPSVTKILGYSVEELIGTSPYALFHPDDIQMIHEQSHAQAKAGKEVLSAEYRIRKKDGEFVWFSTNTKPLLDQDGNVTGLQTTSRDITERIANLHKLEELNQQKSKLFSIISHDLRGPLASCMGLLNLTRSATSTEELHKLLELAQKSTLNLHDLMEDLLLWAGSQFDKIYYEPELVRLREITDVVVKRFTEMAQLKNITITVDLEDPAIQVFVDKDMIRTVIRNLVSNAIKFTWEGGHVILAARRIEGNIEVSVTDNGVGIRPEDVAELFEKSITVSTYGTRGEKGTGLGLDICRDFVEKNHGKIWVESEFGSGSRFCFTLKEF